MGPDAGTESYKDFALPEVDNDSDDVVDEEADDGDLDPSVGDEEGDDDGEEDDEEGGDLEEGDDEEGDDEEEDDDEEGDEEEDDSDDLDARTAKAITFKTPKGDKITVPKDALFPHKANGKIEWIPVAKIARQFDGIQNYSQKLSALNDKENGYRSEVAKRDQAIKKHTEKEQKASDVQGQYRKIFAQGTADQKVEALDHFLSNEAQTSTKMFMFDLIEHLTPWFEQYNEMDDMGKRALRAEAKNEWRDTQDDLREKADQEKGMKGDQEKIVKETQQKIESYAKSYNFTPEDFDKHYDNLLKEHKDGKRANPPNFEDTLVATMNTRIHGLATDLGPKKVNPIFKDPKKAAKLGDAMFKLWLQNPKKPTEWFLKIARETYGQKKAAKKVNEHLRKKGSKRKKPSSKKELSKEWRF